MKIALRVASPLVSAVLRTLLGAGCMLSVPHRSGRLGLAQKPARSASDGRYNLLHDVGAAGWLGWERRHARYLMPLWVLTLERGSFGESPRLWQRLVMM